MRLCPAEHWLFQKSQALHALYDQSMSSQDLTDCEVKFHLVKGRIMVMVRFQTPFQIRCGRAVTVPQTVRQSHNEPDATVSLI